MAETPASRRKHSTKQRESVHHKAVDDRRDKGEEIRHAKAPQQQAHGEQQHRLQTVFRHAEGDKTPRRRQPAVKKVCRRNHHGNAEVGLFHQDNAPCNKYDVKYISKFRTECSLHSFDPSNKNEPSPFGIETEKAHLYCTRLSSGAELWQRYASSSASIRYPTPSSLMM